MLIVFFKGQKQQLALALIGATDGLVPGYDRRGASRPGDAASGRRGEPGTRAYFGARG